MTKIQIYDEDYALTMEDDDRMAKIKEAVFALNSIQRKIFLTYVEIGTYAGTAKEYGVSVPTIKKYLKKIKENILKHIDDDNKPTAD